MATKEPFKFLDAYTKKDAEIFFGRETEIEELYTRMFYSKLLLVYGQSGTGKTSLIQCGLANRFEESDWLPVFIRYGENIFDAIHHELEKVAMTPFTPEVSLEKQLQSLYLDHFKPIYLIFDQFEELFIFGSEHEREQFAKEIASILNAAFEIKIIFVIREEYLAELTALESSLPDLFTNRIRIERMGRTAAMQAIEEPCRVCDIRIEAGLPEQILERLGATKVGVIELTYLQVVLDKLYKKAITSNREMPCLTTVDLEALGTIGDVLGAFLEEQLAAMRAEDAALGEAVLKTLITPDGTKKVMGVDEIVAALTGLGHSATPEQVAAVLSFFVSVRILGEKEESGRYELRHDSLAQKILERMTALEKDLLEVMQMIENRYKEYQSRGTLLDKSALEYVAPYASRLSFKPHLAGFITASRREITKIRRRQLTTLVVALVVIFGIVSGLGVLSYFKYREAEVQRKRAEEQTDIAQAHLRQSQRNEIEALNQTSRVLFLSHDELGALLAGVKAGINATRTEIPTTLTFQTLFNVQALVAGVHEKNRLEGHDLPVNSVAFSPDGTLLAAGSNDTTITLWNVADGLKIRTLQGHVDDGFDFGFVNSVAFSPDGRLLASGSQDRTIKLWQVADGRELMTLQGHAGPVKSVVFSPDGRLLASGSWDQTIKLWNVADGQEIMSFQGHAGAVNSVVFHADGTMLASGSADQTIKLWNVSTGSELRTLHGHTYDVLSLVFSPDGKQLASGSADTTIKLWQVADGEERMTLKGHTDLVQSLSYSPDGAQLVSGSDDQTIKLWDVTEGRELMTFGQHAAPVLSVQFSPDGVLLASSSVDTSIKLWQVAGEREITTLQGHTEDVQSVAFSSDGILLASGSSDTTVKLWQVATGRETMSLHGHTRGIYSVAFSPERPLLASGSGDHTIRLWNAFDSRELTTLHGHSDGVRDVAFSQDGTLLASGSWDQTIKLWNVANGMELAAFRQSNAIRDVDFSPDGALLVSGDRSGWITLWRVADRQELFTLRGHAEYIECVVFSPDGRLLASGSLDQTIKFWQASNGSEIRTLDVHDLVYSITFSPDGRLLASGGQTGIIRLWQVADGQELGELRGHVGLVYSVAFSPDGKLLASGSADNTVRLWHIDLEYYLARGCTWLSGYLNTNPNLSETDRGVCDGVLQ